MAKKQIHELSDLGRIMTGTDTIAVDTGSATRKAYPYQIKAGVVRDSTSGSDIDVSFSHAYLTPTSEKPVYLAAMQRQADNDDRPLISTIGSSTAKTLLDVSKVRSEVVHQSDLTIGNNGWVEIAKPSSGVPLFAMVTTWATMSSPYTALAIAGTGSHWYLTGTPGVTVTGMDVRFFFVD